MTTDTRNAQAVIELFEQAATILRDSPLRKGSIVRLPARGRLLVTGDLHDNPIHLRKIIALAKLDKSPDHHVILHEMIHSERLVNGLDFSHRILIKAAELVVRFPDQVHPLLANHELSQLTGTGVTKGAGNNVALFDDGLAFAFGDDWESVSEAIKQFISGFGLALMSESGLFCSHSLPSPHLMPKFDATVIERELQPGDLIGPLGAAYLMLWGRSHTPAQIEQLAQLWGVKVFCIGHEHAETGYEIRGPRLVVLNSDHEYGAVLPVDLAHLPSPEEAFMSVVPLSAVPLNAAASGM